MTLRVPVLGTEHDTVLHRRDARVKLALFGLLIGVLYAASTWYWLAGLALAGLVLAYVARVPPLWLAVLWVLQLPAIIGFFVVPVISEFSGAGPVQLQDEIAYGLRLGSAWAAALFVSITIFSTMRVNELVDGMRGLRIPEAVCFATGYAFLLLYTSLNDIFRIVDGLRVKGVDFETKNPYRIGRSAVKLLIPALFSTVRRSATMMGALQQRGFSFTTRRPRTTTVKFDAGDGLALLAGVAVLTIVLCARFGLLG